MKSIITITITMTMIMIMIRATATAPKKKKKKKKNMKYLGLLYIIYRNLLNDCYIKLVLPVLV